MEKMTQGRCVWGGGGAESAHRVVVDPGPCALTRSVNLTLPYHQVKGADVMQLSNNGQQIILRGSGGIELASTFNWYLNDYLNITYVRSCSSSSLSGNGRGLKRRKIPFGANFFRFVLLRKSWI